MVERGLRIVVFFVAYGKGPCGISALPPVAPTSSNTSNGMAKPSGGATLAEDLVKVLSPKLSLASPLCVCMSVGGEGGNSLGEGSDNFLASVLLEGQVSLIALRLVITG